MNDLIPSHDDRMPDWYDPFDELRTTPPGWELAALNGGPSATPTTAAPRGPVQPPASFTRLDVSLN